jgi:carbonic anhydrase/acetyltransferase-like protein (isoleucine patch superfamily)
VLIGHSVVVHGTRIGSNTLIGNNATILDGAQIGCFCIIGAGCLVSQDMVIPDNSFVVGVPAKIRSQISPERRRGLATGPGAYAELARRYKEQGL